MRSLFGKVTRWARSTNCRVNFVVYKHFQYHKLIVGDTCINYRISIFFFFALNARRTQFHARRHFNLEVYMADFDIFIFVHMQANKRPRLRARMLRHGWITDKLVHLTRYLKIKAALKNDVKIFWTNIRTFIDVLNAIEEDIVFMSRYFFFQAQIIITAKRFNVISGCLF